MSIVTMIEDLVEGLDTGILSDPEDENSDFVPATFFHGEESYQNKEGDEMELPGVFLFEPIVSNDEIKGSLIEETYPTKMFFANKSETDWTPEQHQVVIGAMRELSRKFLVALRSSEKVRYVKNIKRTDVKNLFDVNLSGVFLEVSITPFNSNPAC
jgi:hypothetical protein